MAMWKSGIILRIFGIGFKKRTSDDGWHHSTFDSVKPEQLTAEKFHVEVRFGRYREDKSLIGKYRSLYIVTFEKTSGALKQGQALAKGKTNELFQNIFVE